VKSYYFLLQLNKEDNQNVGCCHSYVFTVKWRDGEEKEIVAGPDRSFQVI